MKQVHFILKNKLTTRKKIKYEKDTTRYKRRKRDRNLNKSQRMAEDMILNKSDYDIKLEHKLLLLKGPNFVPTPNWSGRTEDEEYLNFLAHIWRVEWDGVITENEDQFQTDKIPSKLQIKIFNRPDKDLVDAKTRADVNSVHSKLKTIKVSSKNSYRNNNNLNFNQRMALDYLQNLVKKCKIVICKSDKNGKIIIVNFKNYNTIMEKELKIFENITQLDPGNISNHLNLISRTADNFVIELHKLGILDDDMLKHTIGVKNYTRRGIEKFRQTWLNIFFVIHLVMLIHSSKRIKLLLILLTTFQFLIYPHVFYNQPAILLHLKLLRF